MYKVKKIGYVIGDTAYYCLLEKALRITYESRLWKIWRAIITSRTCYYCASMNGRILAVDDPKIAEIPIHPNCKCYIESLSSIVAGTATNAGADGVDLYVALHGVLPNNYLTQAEAYEADFDYDGGYRNSCRLLYSNDGLLFVTYDHYMSFYEIGLENIV